MLKTITLFFLTAILLMGCGETQENQNGQDNQNNQNGQAEGEEDMNETPLDYSLEESENGFVYSIENTGDSAVTLSFTTGQRYEYELSRDGEVVQRFSDGRAFNQALQDITVEPDEEVTFEVELPEMEPGEYRINIFLVAADLMEESEIEETFTME